MSEQPILILGAGIAGLTAAYHLLESRKEEQRSRVVLLEKEDRAGGLAVSLSRKGVVTDLGPHRLHTELPEVKALLEEVAQERLIEVSRESHIYWRGERLRYPISPFELLLKIGPVPMARLATSAFRAKLSRINSSAPDSFEQVMRGQFGDALWREMLGPYSEKVWKRPPSQVHGDVARVRVSAGGIANLAKRIVTLGREKTGTETALKTFKYPKGGLQTLVDILVRRVEELGGEILCNSPVRNLRAETVADDRSRIAALTAGENGEYHFEKPRAVISTIPLPSLGHLLGGSLQPLTEKLEYLGLLLVVLIIRKERLSRDNWLYFFDESFALNRAYEAKNFDPDMAPPGKTVLCCEVTARPGSTLWSIEHETLIAEVAGQIASTGLFREEELEDAYVQPVRWAYPLYSIDYRDRLRTIFDQLGTWENLLSCGRQGLFNHNNTDHSMAMGMSAARTIREHPESPGRPWFDGVLERFGHFRIVD